jgi:hypothetical protein
VEVIFPSGGKFGGVEKEGGTPRRGWRGIGGRPKGGGRGSVSGGILGNRLKEKLGNPRGLALGRKKPEPKKYFDKKRRDMMKQIKISQEDLQSGQTVSYNSSKDNSRNKLAELDDVFGKNET